MLARNDAQLKNLLVTTHKRLAGSSHILLISGDHPDGDAFGSLIGLYHYAQAIGKKVTCFSAVPVPGTLSFMPLPELIFAENHIPKDVDVAISFDHSDIEQTGLTDWLTQKKPHLINIDHHRSNGHWGDTNIIRTDAAATCELIYNLYRVNSVPLSKNAAHGLLTGLMTDTGNLSNPATSSTAMSTASALIKLGGQAQPIVKKTYKNKTLPSLKLWGDIINQIELNNNLGIAIVVVTNQQLKKYDANEEWLEGLVNFLIVLDDVKTIMLLREIEPGVLKGSFRTTQDTIDVGLLAEVLGGGGHQKAAGFSITGTLAKMQGCWYIS